MLELFVEPCTATLTLIEFFLGIVNVIGFSSFFIQIDLILKDGIDPAYKLISKWEQKFPWPEDASNLSLSSRLYLLWRRFQFRKSIFWLMYGLDLSKRSSSTDINQSSISNDEKNSYESNINKLDQYIRYICLLGVVLGINLSCLALNMNSFILINSYTMCYLLNGIFYLSLINISGDFLGLQSDSNLVETNILMCFAGIFRFHCPIITIFILRWLAFRTMLGCGICKWFGSGMWKNLTAMIHHYYTQPLPNPISYYVHKQSEAIHKLSVILTFIIEGPLGFLIFGPTTLRCFAFIGYEGINLLINTTGNYGFIGALNMTENMSILSDNMLPSVIANFLTERR